MRHTKPTITIRIGAAHDSVTVDGHVFDRSKMPREEKSKLRRIIRDCFRSLHQQGTWGKQAKIAAPGVSAYLRGPHDPAFKAARAA